MVFALPGDSLVPCCFAVVRRLHLLLFGVGTLHLGICSNICNLEFLEFDVLAESICFSDSFNLQGR